MSQSTVFTSNKPYLFRGILDWILDNEATPYILVDATKVGVDVPQEHIKDGQIVLNVNPSAVQNWLVDNQAISFNARFSGASRSIYVPMYALLAVYAQENGQGMAFPEEEANEAQEGANESSERPTQPKLAEVEASDSSLKEDSQSSTKRSSHLKLIK
ncbi:ClpXP protease specificity-enhancing factor [Aliikangiella sp. IMCC44653]